MVDGTNLTNELVIQPLPDDWYTRAKALLESKQALDIAEMLAL